MDIGDVDQSADTVHNLSKAPVPLAVFVDHDFDVRIHAGERNSPGGVFTQHDVLHDREGDARCDGGVVLRLIASSRPSRS